jgi:hypothetical protein
MPRPEFEPAIPATKRQQTYALARAATGIGYCNADPYLGGTELEVRLWDQLKRSIYFIKFQSLQTNARILYLL